MEPKVISRSDPFERRSFNVPESRSEAVSTTCSWRVSFDWTSLMSERVVMSVSRDSPTRADNRCNSAVAASTSLRVSSMTSMEPTSSAAPKRHPLGASRSPRRVTMVAAAFTSTAVMAWPTESAQPMWDNNESRRAFNEAGALTIGRTCARTGSAPCGNWAPALR